VVIKFGPGVIEDEAKNQAKAYEVVDHNIVRVSKVHRFFTDPHGWGYLIMDFMDGRITDLIEDQAKVIAVATILAYFATLYRDIPGPLGGGASYGLLFEDAGQPTFRNIADIERWCNCRIFAHEAKLDHRGYKPVQYHLDVAPRNFLWRDEKPPCLLDWSSGGYYPRYMRTLRPNDH
jgi:hypothetical protein